MRQPLRLSTQHPASKWVASALIAALATGLAFGLRHAPHASVPLALADDALYDGFYHFRQPEDRTGGPIVIAAVDQAALEQLGKRGFGWPWPREFWGMLIQYLQKCGVKVIAFDILFTEQSFIERYAPGDDEKFANAIDRAMVPVVLANLATPSGPGAFAPPVQKPPMFGAVNILTDKVIRQYPPSAHGLPSLGVRVAQVIGAPVRPWASEPFRLHYYGPHVQSNGKQTYRYLSLAGLLSDAKPKKGQPLNIDPATLKDKIVLVGTIAAGTFDLKSSPLSPLYPGIEAHATAIENLLNDQHVRLIKTGRAMGLTFAAALLAALGVTLPRRVSLKMLFAALVSAGFIVIAILFFRSPHLRWLPMAAPLLALILSTVGAFAWSYVAEDRARRIIFKALAQSTSPAIAAELARDPDRLNVGGQRRAMTVMFTDLAGFTDLSETLEVEKLTTLMNFYLEEMSSILIGENGFDGYLDKYIGDAIMTFWNGLVDQNDHAILACRSALAIQRREIEIQPELRRLGAARLLTRIGINSGPMAVGNMGSRRKFAYTVLGDSVNLAARLEGANKLYGSQILIAKETADQVKDHFTLRQLDVLRVKGKQKPMAVYEVLAEGTAAPDVQSRVIGYEQALTLYQQQKWDEGESILRPLAEQFPTDGSVQALLARIAKLRKDPPPPDWDGVYVAKDK